MLDFCVILSKNSEGIGHMNLNIYIYCDYHQQSPRKWITMRASLWMWLEAELEILFEAVLCTTEHQKLSNLGVRLMKRLVDVGILTELHP